MGWTKRQFVTSAFEELGLAEYTFDLPADALQSGMKRLDSMMGEWNGRGIRLGYPLPDSPTGGDLDDVTAVPDRANEAVIANLAVRIGPSFGKQLRPETKATAKRAYNQLLTAVALPTERLSSIMVAGAGNKPWIFDEPFLPGTSEGLTTGSDGELDFT